MRHQKGAVSFPTLMIKVLSRGVQLKLVILKSCLPNPVAPLLTSPSDITNLDSDMLSPDVDVIGSAGEVERPRHVDGPRVSVAVVPRTAVDPDMQRYPVAVAVFGRLERLEAGA